MLKATNEALNVKSRGLKLGPVKLSVSFVLHDAPYHAPPARIASYYFYENGDVIIKERCRPSRWPWPLSTNSSRR